MKIAGDIQLFVGDILLDFDIYKDHKGLIHIAYVTHEWQGYITIAISSTGLVRKLRRYTRSPRAQLAFNADYITFGYDLYCYLIGA